MRVAIRQILCCLAAWTCLAAAAEQPDPAGPATPRGVFAYMQTPHFFEMVDGRPRLRPEAQLDLLYQVIERDYIAGVTYYVPWDLLEPRPGEFRWELVDVVLSEVASRGKTMNLGIFSRDAPKWLREDPAVARVTQAFTRQGTGDTIEREVPLVLDRRYLDAYYRMVDAVAGHRVAGSTVALGAHPALGYVAIGGPSNGSGLETLLQVVPREADQLKRTVSSLSGQDDWTRGYATFWTEARKRYQAAFPGKRLAVALSFGLDVGTPKERTAKVAEAVFEDFGRSGDRPALMTLNLTGAAWWYPNRGGKNAPRRILGLVAEGARSGFPAGFQMIGIAYASREAEARARPFSKALENGVRVPADWIEVWVEDLLPDRSGIIDRRPWVSLQHPDFAAAEADVTTAAGQLRGQRPGS